MGDFFVFTLAQKVVKKEIKKKLKAGVPESEIIVISLTSQEMQSGKDGFRWVKPNKEFWYKGSMYDVVRKTESEGRNTFHCINDKQETQLFIHLDEMVRKNLPQNENAANKTKSLTTGIIKTGLLHENENIRIFNSCNLIHFIDQPFGFNNYFTHIELPPP